jgi:arginine deiminase
VSLTAASGTISGVGIKSARMQLNVTSEIGRLKSVLVHLPGREIDIMIPSMMEELLFDDILYGQVAREEHRRFQQVIWFIAENVLDIQDLLEEIFEDEGAKEAVLSELSRQYPIDPAVLEYLGGLAATPLAEALVSGVTLDGNVADGFDLTPLPNLFFMRDPQVVLGSGVAFSLMATEARSREPLLSRIAFRYHPAFRDVTNFWMDPFAVSPKGGSSARKRRPTIEGGDILIPRRDLLLVGLSERTNRAGIEYLIESLKKSNAGVKTILIVELPKQRSCMHLDTVFTLISRDECLVYPPSFLGGPDEAQVYAVDLTKRELTFTSQKGLLHALKKRGMDLKPISCGGESFIDQQREQWTDGANAFTLAPGVVLLYERNIRTAEELARNGYHIVYEDDLLLGRTELETWSDKKYAIQVQGHELSRARGGPRCMTMPLEREDL